MTKKGDKNTNAFIDAYSNSIEQIKKGLIKFLNLKQFIVPDNKGSEYKINIMEIMTNYILTGHY